MIIKWQNFDVPDVAGGDVASSEVGSSENGMDILRDGRGGFELFLMSTYMGTRETLSGAKKLAALMRGGGYEAEKDKS